MKLAQRITLIEYYAFMIGGVLWGGWIFWSVLVRPWDGHWDQWIAISFFLALAFHVAKWRFAWWREGRANVTVLFAAAVEEIWNPPWAVSWVLQIVMNSLTTLVLLGTALFLMGRIAR